MENGPLAKKPGTIYPSVNNDRCYDQQLTSNFEYLNADGNFNGKKTFASIFDTAVPL